MSKTKVVNLKQHPYDVYIGRTGKGQSGEFGNPIVRGQVCPICKEIHNDAGSTLVCFKQYFLKRLEEDKDFRDKVLALRGKTLGCFCKPNPCHGDIIADWCDLH